MTSLQTSERDGGIFVLLSNSYFISFCYVPILSKTYNNSIFIICIIIIIVFNILVTVYCVPNEKVQAS